jgi:hypothetical protein
MAVFYKSTLYTGLQGADFYALKSIESYSLSI